MRKARPDDLVVDQAGRAIFAHQGLDALPPVTAPFREICADVAATRDQRGAVGLALAVVTRKGRGYITAAAGQRIGEAFGVDGGLHYAGRHMGPGDES